MMLIRNNKLRKSNTLSRKTTSRGFTLIELIVGIVILGILATAATSRFTNLGKDARIAAINGLKGSVSSALTMVRGITEIRGQGTAGAQVNITWVNMDSATSVRLWSGYPDRWCDGIGTTLSGSTVPSGGCYLSTAAVPFGDYTFYGYGNSTIPNGDAGWRIETAPSPMNCSVAYRYNGTGSPLLITTTSGC